MAAAGIGVRVHEEDKGRRVTQPILVSGGHPFCVVPLDPGDYLKGHPYLFLWTKTDFK